ncbi:nuclear transport factor 2 family protein [Nocardia sp. CA-128927]|uniref:nuclear transport factor 2 family protein n=1 Tax=Nocardia sp. CA-128927 TaxID=3239975 RepID=UPI003D9586C3
MPLGYESTRCHLGKDGIVMLDTVRTQKIRIIEQFFFRISTKDLDGLLALCTEDTQMSIPYQLPGFPDYIDGADEVRQAWSALDRYEPSTIAIVNVEPMLNPDAFLVEAKGHMIVAETGRPYRNDYLNIFRFRDGKIAEWTCYRDPMRQVAAFGAEKLATEADSLAPMAS